MPSCHRTLSSCSRHALLAAVGLAPIVAAQQLPVVGLSVATDYNGDYTDGYGFVQLKCTASETVAGLWFATLTDARPEIANGYGNLTPYLQAPPIIPFADIAATWGEATGYGLHPAVAAPQANVDAFMSLLLLRESVPNPTAPRQLADALYHAPLTISQMFGQRRATWNQEIKDEWLVSDDITDPWFNIDALVERAIWRRVANHYNGDYVSFFKSIYWDKMSQKTIFLTFQTIGARGPSLLLENVPEQGSYEDPPDLTGYPEAPVKLTNSESKQITFVGSSEGGATGQILLNFHCETAGVPLNRISNVIAGQGVTEKGAGFRPGMQIKLAAVGNPAVTFVVNVFFAGFGEFTFRMPSGAAGLVMKVADYRYRYENNGSYVYTNWQHMSDDHSPHYVVNAQ